MDVSIKKEKNRSLITQIIVFAIPLMLTGFLQLLYNACDLMVVGNFAGDRSDVSLAAVGANTSLISLIFNVFFGLSIGANIVISNAVGEKNIEKGQRALHSSILLSLICGVLLGLICMIFAEVFLVWTDCPSEVLPYATTYLRIYLIGAPANLLFNFAQSNLRAVKDTKTPLIILGITGLINLILNYIFVAHFHMAVEGVAIATVVAQYLSAITVMVVLIKSNNPYIKFSFHKLRFYSKETKELVLHGIPAGFQGSIFSLSNVILQSAVNSFNTVVMSGKSAAFSIDNFVYQAMNSFYTATIVFMGQGYGAKDVKKMKNTFWLCNLCVIIISFLLGGFIMIFSTPLASLYTDTEEAIDACRKIMFTVLPLYFICGCNEVACGALRSLKHPLLPTCVSLVFICGVRIIWVYTVFRMKHDIQVLYLSYPLSWLIAWIIHIILYFVLRKKSFQKCLEA